MYRLIVAARVRHIFTRLDASERSIVSESPAPAFVYRFYGDHALGGERRTLAAMRAWWGRLFRLLPGARFEARYVLVAGWPWPTRVATVQIADGSRRGETA